MEGGLWHGLRPPRHWLPRPGSPAWTLLSPPRAPGNLCEWGAPKGPPTLLHQSLLQKLFPEMRCEPALRVSKAGPRCPGVTFLREAVLGTAGPQTARPGMRVLGEWQSPQESLREKQEKAAWRGSPRTELGGQGPARACRGGQQRDTRPTAPPPLRLPPLSRWRPRPAPAQAGEAGTLKTWAVK